MSKSMFNQVVNHEVERQKRMECPTCGSKMVEVGALTVAIPDNDPRNGQYCARCYRDWIAATLPKFIDPKEVSSADIVAGQSITIPEPSQIILP